MTLKDKVALVTGSTGSIGLAVADRLAAAGAALCIHGLGDAKTIEAAREKVARHGGKVVFHGADLSQAAEAEALVAFTQKELGGLDILINNAGIQHVAPVDSFPPEKWDQVIAINLSAPFHLTRLALPAMRQKGWGRIVNIASAHGLVASVEKAAYVAAKHGIVGLTKVTALETATTAITCNAICPGWVLTPLVQKQIDALATRDGLSNDAAREKLLLAKQPSGTFVEVEKLAELTLFLCSNAASEMRGSIITMDGGWTAQ